MGIINVLPLEVASKISAGEVVERPSSVVKELMENSIDAKSKNISVEVMNAGKSMIKITDDGVGMSCEDALLCIERHATSKIKYFEDLGTLNTLGFRGEALASIGAVSKMQIITRRKNDDLGIHISVQNGEITDKKETGCLEGTTMIVKDLFYNTPARLKFLKRDAAEFNAIYDIFCKICLSYPDISFKLIHNDKLKLMTKGDGSLLNVIKEIYGEDILSSMIKVDYADAGISVKGYISDKSVIKKNRNDFIFFINKRYAVNKTLYAAVLDVYKEYLTHGTYPLLVLFIDIEPSIIDVNVHPAKTEIKFSDDHFIFNSLHNAVRQALYPKIAENLKLHADSDFSPNQWSNNAGSIDKESYRGTVGKEFVDTPNMIHDQTVEEDDFLNFLSGEESEYIYIGQIFSTYLLYKKDDEFIIIDQHAAHERILYEKFLKAYKSEGIPSQRLIVPMVISLKLNEKSIIEENAESIKKLGYEVENFDEHSILIRAVPVIFGQPQAKAFIEDFIASYDLTNVERTKQDEILFSRACKAAIKANDSIAQKEAEALITDLFKCENPYNCPHGRPTMIKYTRSDIEKLFKRVI